MGKRILLVDDDALLLKNLRLALSREPYAVDTASNGAEALESIQRAPPQLVLLDAVMPRMDGLETCRAIKALGHASFIPVILLTSRDDMDYKVKALQNGVDDFVTKPFDVEELKARIASMLRIKANQDQLVARTEMLEQLREIDVESGLPTERAGADRLEQEFKRSKRYTDPLTLMLIRLNGLMADRWKSVGQLIQGSLRETDYLARRGTEDLLIILPQTHGSGALPVAQRIWQALEELDKAQLDSALRSGIGMACYPSRNLATLERLLLGAEDALAQALEKDGDRVCLHHQIEYQSKGSEASRTSKPPVGS